MSIPYSTKLWRDKTLAELELQEYWRRKLWRLAEAKPIQYLSLQDLATFWRIKLWQIGNEPPNSPKFSPAKVLCYMVVLKKGTVLIIKVLPGCLVNFEEWLDLKQWNKLVQSNMYNIHTYMVGFYCEHKEFCEWSI